MSIWFYCSFAADEGFRGACFVKAVDAIGVVRVTHQLGINPGGEVLIIENEDDFECPANFSNRLLTHNELCQMDAFMGGAGEVATGNELMEALQQDEH